MNRLLAAGLALLAALPALAQEEDVEGRMRARWLMQAYPDMTIDAAARYQAWLDWREVPVARGTGVQTADTEWVCIGPESFTGLFAARMNGRVNAMAIHPQNSSIVYLGTSEGGIWKSDNAGDNWVPLTDDQPTLQCDAIAIDPNNPDTVYAGTGSILPYLTHAGAHRSYIAAGLLRSTDAGATWSLLATETFLGASITEIRIDPVNSNRVYVAATNGIWLSEDAGEAFVPLLPGFATDLELLPGSPNELYAAIGDLFGDINNGVYYSPDDGQNWTLIEDLPFGVNVGRIEIGVSQSDYNVAYVAVAGAYPDAYVTGIYKTTDRGATWSSLPRPENSPSYHWFILVMAVHPTDPNVAFFGGLDLYRTTNGGLSWSYVTPYHVDQHQIAFAPSDPSIAFEGNDGGIFRGTDVAGSISWSQVNNDMITALFYSVASHPTDPDFCIGGLQDNGLAIYSGSRTWRHTIGADGIYTAIDPLTPTRMYCSVQGGPIYRSTNGGDNWSSVGSGSGNKLFLMPYVLSPTTPSTIYTGSNRLYRSTTAGGNWVQISDRLTESDDPELNGVTAIGVGSDEQHIYAGTADGKLWATPDGGSTWTDLSGKVPNRWIAEIAVHPDDPLTAYVGLGGHGTPHLYRTTDGGATFDDVSHNLPDLIVNEIRFDPLNHGVLYVGNELGILVGDGESDWFRFEGLPNVGVLGIAPTAGTNTLRIATFGRGMWDRPLTRSVSADVTLQSWLGGDQPVHFELLPASGGLPAMTWELTPAGGSVVLDGVPNGYWRLRAKASHWLAQTLDVGAIAGNVSGLAFSLINGDATDDNVVDLSDLNSLLVRFGGAGGAEDLDGGGQVDLPDLNIVLVNFGMTGD
jgi:photosystem II stability/assembly factor-like uncharacterized protein